MRLMGDRTSRKLLLGAAVLAAVALSHQNAWGACGSTVTTGSGTPDAQQSHGIKENNNIAGQTFKAPGSGCIALESVTFSVQKAQIGRRDVRGPHRHRL